MKLAEKASQTAPIFLAFVHRNASKITSNILTAISIFGIETRLIISRIIHLELRAEPVLSLFDSFPLRLKDDFNNAD